MRPQGICRWNSPAVCKIPETQIKLTPAHCQWCDCLDPPRTPPPSVQHRWHYPHCPLHFPTAADRQACCRRYSADDQVRRAGWGCCRTKTRGPAHQWPAKTCRGCSCVAPDNRGSSQSSSWQRCCRWWGTRWSVCVRGRWGRSLVCVHQVFGKPDSGSCCCWFGSCSPAQKVNKRMSAGLKELETETSISSSRSWLRPRRLKPATTPPSYWVPCHQTGSHQTMSAHRTANLLSVK